MYFFPVAIQDGVLCHSCTPRPLREGQVNSNASLICSASHVQEIAVQAQNSDMVLPPSGDGGLNVCTSPDASPEQLVHECQPRVSPSHKLECDYGLAHQVLADACAYAHSSARRVSYGYDYRELASILDELDNVNLEAADLGDPSTVEFLSNNEANKTSRRSSPSPQPSTSTSRTPPPRPPPPQQKWGFSRTWPSGYTPPPGLANQVDYRSQPSVFQYSPHISTPRCSTPRDYTPTHGVDTASWFEDEQFDMFDGALWDDVVSGGYNAAMLFPKREDMDGQGQYDVQSGNGGQDPAVQNGQGDEGAEGGEGVPPAEKPEAELKPIKENGH